MQGLGGLAPGLNRGATMSGNKASSGAPLGLFGGFADMQIRAFGYTGNIVSPIRGDAHVFVFGTGGGNAGSNYGSGAGAAYRKASVQIGDTFVCTIPAQITGGGGVSGGLTSVAFPTGDIVSATGGGGSMGTPGIGINGTINRSGGLGVSNSGGVLGGLSPDPGGGVPLSGDYGGAGAGFGDLVPFLVGGTGGSSSGFGGGGPPRLLSITSATNANSVVVVIFTLSNG